MKRKRHEPLHSGVFSWPLIVSAVILFVPCVHSYRRGQVVDTDIRLDARVSDALRSQMPLFGLDASAQFSFDSIDAVESPSTTTTFAMTFEDGLWTTPSVALQNRNHEYLQSFQVDFLYSKAGSLESVSTSQTPVYAKDKPKFFRVDYKWTVEDAPHVVAAMNLMMIVVFAACIYFLFEAFSMSPDGGSGTGGGWTMGKEHDR